MLVFTVILTLLTKPLGSYMADVFEGRRTFLSRFLIPVERITYRLCGIDAEQQQEWKAYAGSCLAFSLVSALLFYAHLRLQGLLPLNPQGFGTPSAPQGATPMTPDLAFNIATSFMTNTSWQSWSGETTLSALSQMLGIAVQSFTSAAAGMAVAVALIRSFARQESDRLGNFWVDTTKSVLYILLPLSFIGALFLCSQGVAQTLGPWQKAATLEGGAQTIPLGPVASQEPIKLLSSDGGGFFNANSAHPFENPTDAVRSDDVSVPRGQLYYDVERTERDSLPECRFRRCRRKHGGQRSQVRRSRLVCLLGRKHGIERRSGQQYARQLYAA